MALTAEAPDPQERAIQESERGRIRECISKLSERERQIVELYYYRELNFKEIGSLLGVTESRISQLHSKLKKKLRRELSAEFDRA